MGDPLGRAELVGHVPGELLRLRAARTVEGIRSEADPAHRLDPTGDPGIDGIGTDQIGHEVIGLLRRSALTVDRGRRSLIGKPLAQPGRPGHVRCLLAGLGDTAADDLLDLAGIDPGPLDQFDLGVPE